MANKKIIYEGKAKILYEGPDPDTIIQYFKDDATANNAEKHAVINGKGVLNNAISDYLMQKINEIGIPTHYIKKINMREQLVRKVEIIPVEFVVRNIAAGSIVKKLGLKELDVSNLTSTIDKAAQLRSRPKGMPEHLGERGFKTRVDTPTRDGDGPKTIAEQVTQGAGLEEGQKMLGMDDKQIQQIYQGRDLLKQTIESGMYQDRKLNMNEIKMLQGHMMKMESLIQNIESYQVRSGSAYGGRIDKALGGRSRDIG